MATEYHIIDDCFVDQIAHFDKARHSGHQSKYGHLRLFIRSL